MRNDLLLNVGLGTLGILRPVRAIDNDIAVPTICVSGTAGASTVNVGMVMSRMVKSPTRLKLIACPPWRWPAAPHRGREGDELKLPVSRISF
jgi:hypothetical protein